MRYLLSNVISLTWTMASRGDGGTAGTGLHVLAIGLDAWAAAGSPVEAQAPTR